MDDSGLTLLHLILRPMESFPPHLAEKFTKFQQAYDEARVWLVDVGGGPETVARNTFNAALKEVPLTDEELEMYRSWLKIN